MYNIFHVMFRLRPTLLIALTFLAVIASGAVLLHFPISSATGKFTNFLDAYFTANSATCVTGLVTLDTGTHFSLFGKLVILGLIQIGGLGYMTISTFLTVMFRQRMFITEKLMMQEVLNIHSTKDVLNVMKKIFGIVIIIEGIGAFVLFLRWLPELGAKKALFWGVFHSVSAFCNAGFALPANFANLTAFKGDLAVNLTITSLIILGGLGFLVIADIIQNRRFSLHSKIVIWTTLFLIVSGTLMIFAIEFNNNASIALFSVKDKLLSSYFQAVTPRTAGFNTIAIEHLAHPTLILMMALMFIGASPGGTGGGIKTTTFTLIIATIWATLKDRKNTVIAERKIPAETVRKAFAVFFLSIMLVAGGIFLLNGTERFSLMEIAFEVFSAFGTVGLSMGITPLLSDYGKTIIITVMFLGRIGTLSFLLGFAGERKKENLKYPKEGISIG